MADGQTTRILNYSFTMEDIEREMLEGYISRRYHPTNPRLSIYNYTNKTQYSQNWNPVTMHCRGLVLENLPVPFNGCYYIPRNTPMPKFFNYERRLVQPFLNKLDISQGSWMCISRKWDGWLGNSYWNPLSRKYEISTRGGFDNAVALKATEIVSTPAWQKQIEEWTRSAESFSASVAFEIIGPETKIVVDYEKFAPELFKKHPLILIPTKICRYKYDYVNENQRDKCGLDILNFPERFIDSFPDEENPFKIILQSSMNYMVREANVKFSKFNSWDDFLYDYESFVGDAEYFENYSMKDLPLRYEGYVAHIGDSFGNTMMFKSKYKRYIEASKALSGLTDKKIVESLRDDKLLSLLEYVPDEFTKEIIQKSMDFRVKFDEIEEECRELFEQLKISSSHTGKIIRTAFEKNSRYLDSTTRSILFMMLDKRDYSRIIWGTILQDLKTQG